MWYKRGSVKWEKFIQVGFKGPCQWLLPRVQPNQFQAIFTTTKVHLTHSPRLGAIPKLRGGLSCPQGAHLGSWGITNLQLCGRLVDSKACTFLLIKHLSDAQLMQSWCVFHIIRPRQIQGRPSAVWFQVPGEIWLKTSVTASKGCLSRFIDTK